MRRSTVAYSEGVINGARQLFEVTAWLGTSYLGPVDVVTGSWRVTDTEDSKTPGELAFQVPMLPKWLPTSPYAALATNGQRFRVRAGLELDQRQEWKTLGWFRNMTADPTGDTIDVQARGLLVNVERARFLEPFTVTGSRKVAISKIIRGIMPVRFRVNDDTMRSGSWEQERIDALWEICESWPARPYVDDAGTLTIGPAFDDHRPGPVVKEIVDGDQGTLVSCQPTAVEESGYNAYRVQNTPDDSTVEPITEFAYLDYGPMRWGGPYLFNPAFYASPLIKDRQQAASTARTMLARARRRNDAVGFTAAPDYRVQIGDVAHLRSTRQNVDMVGRVVELEHTRTALTGKVAYLEGAR